jgi:hypothetical protein
MPLSDDLMIENAIYVARDDFYLWNDGKLKPIIGRHGQLSREWNGQTITLAGIPVDSAVSVLSRQQ